MTANQIWAAIALVVVWVVCFRGAIRAHRDYKKSCLRLEQLKEQHRRERENIAFFAKLHDDAIEDMRRFHALRDWKGFWGAVQRSNAAYVRVCRELGYEPNPENIIPPPPHD